MNFKKIPKNKFKLKKKTSKLECVDDRDPGCWTEGKLWDSMQGGLKCRSSYKEVIYITYI